MKLNRLLFVFGFALLLVGHPLQAQQGGAAKLSELRAKAEKGNAEDQVALGFWLICQVDAKGFPEAYKWLSLAEAQGHGSALMLRNQLEKGMTPEQIAEGQKQAREFRPKTNAQPSGADGKQLAELRAKAEKGDQESQCELGVAFCKGLFGMEQDTVEGAKWYRKAAEQNYAPAQLALGLCFFAGAGVAKDKVKAYEWASLAATQGNEAAKELRDALAKKMTSKEIAEGQKLARDFGTKRQPQLNSGDGMEPAELRAKAEKGDAKAQFNLGWIFFSGRGVAKDYPKAVNWYRKAAEQNYAPAQVNLGYCYDNGFGVAKDEAEAVKWYRKAAEQNDALAQNSLGTCYAHGQGVVKDEAEAVKWWRKAAEQNLAEAQNSLGCRCANGQGVAKDEAVAAKWWRKAAEQNFAEAQYNLGVSYATGRGVAKNEIEAVRWWRKAAEQNHAAAQHNLGASYVTGGGVAKDEAEAVKWWRKAAEQNFAEAQFNLGISYINGDFTVMDYSEAYKWIYLAAAQGFDQARGVLSQLGKRMAPEKLAEGKRRANDWLEQHKKASGGK